MKMSFCFAGQIYIQFGESEKIGNVLLFLETATFNSCSIVETIQPFSNYCAKNNENVISNYCQLKISGS